MKIKKNKFEFFKDIRGNFFEIFNSKRDFFDFKQINLSISKKGVLRGLHYQDKHPQAKLIKVIEGKIFDVIIDLRSNSRTFGKSFTFILSAKDNFNLFVPRGFAHGFLALEKKNLVLYAVDNFYSKKNEKTISWNDPLLQIKWPKLKNYIVSEKDKKGDKFNLNKKYF